METVTVDKCSESEYVPFDKHQILKEKYEKLQIEHENLKKTFELLEKTFGFTLDLVKRQNAMEEIKEWESNIGEMQKRILRKQEIELENNIKRSEKRENEKKEGSLSEEKMLDDAVKTTNEDQVHLSTHENSHQDDANVTKKRKRKRDTNILNAKIQTPKEKETDEKTRVKEVIVGADVKKKKKKSVPNDDVIVISDDSDDDDEGHQREINRRHYII